MRTFILLSLVCCLGLATGARAGGTLTVCTVASPEGFDIAQYATNTTDDAVGITIYDQLLRFKPGTTELAPGIAQTWKVSADGLVYTLFLRRGVKFHSTPWFKPKRDLDADDVMFSINRMLDPANAAHKSAAHGFSYWDNIGMSALIKELSKVDAHTIRFTLKSSNAAFLSNLATPAAASVYSAEYAEQLAQSGKLNQLDSFPVGSGPFIFSDYQKNVQVRYIANKQWWGGPPKIDSLVLAITPDAAQRTRRLKAGQCQVAVDVPPGAVADLESTPSFHIERNDVFQTVYLALNARRKFLSDQRFRLALSIATDKDAYVESIEGNFATAAESLLPAGMWSFDANLSNRGNLELARQLVKASGYDGRELVLFNINSRVVALLQANWARIGVKLTSRNVNLSLASNGKDAGEYDVALLSWSSDNGDPDNFFRPNLSCAAAEYGGNSSHWCNKAFDDLLDTAVRTADVKERARLYVKAQRVIYDEVAVIPLAYLTTITGLSARVHGFVPNPLNRYDFRAVSIE